MAGVNDSDALADDLARLLRGRLCHVNLIPLNPNEDTSLQASSTSRALTFESRLRQADVAATIRVNRGRDILAACGQLRLAEKKQRERRELVILSAAKDPSAAREDELRTLRPSSSDPVKNWHPEPVMADTPIVGSG
jgi:23S rRNA (adenine2503-C2)-methyltransferase